MSKDKRQRIVVVGGGFAGLTAAIECAKRGVGTVTLISERSYFTHHGTLYSTAAGHDPKESAVPLRDILWFHPGVRLVRDTITEVDPRARCVRGAREYGYDVLIMALGMVDHFSDIPGLERHGTGMATLAAAQEFQRRLHQSLAQTPHGTVKLAIIGGGLTGVELAGAVTEYGRRVVQAHGLSETALKVTLVEAGSRLAPRLPKYASRRIMAQLQRVGVDVVLRQRVERVYRRSIVLHGDRQKVDLVAWTSGGQVHPLFRAHPDVFRLSASGRVLVNQYLQAYPGIFVLGDNAQTPDTGTARAAIDQARFLARHLWRCHLGRTPRRRTRRHYPVTVPVARTWAYAQHRGVVVTGLLGALVRRWVELGHYRAFLPLREAWRAWRRHKRIRSDCRLCEK